MYNLIDWLIERQQDLFFNGKWRKYAAAEIDTAVHILEIGYRRSIQYIVYIVLGPDATNK